MSGAKEICTWIPQLEEEEVSGSIERKLDLPIGFESDSYGHDKVNSFHPLVQTRYATTRVQLTTTTEELNCVMPHIQFVVKTISISYSKNLAKVKKTISCHSEPHTSQMQILCPYQIACCIMGPRRSHVLTWPGTPKF